MSGALTGYRHLLRLALRQDRLRLALWVWAVPLLTIASYVTYGDLFPDAASREALSASMVGNPAVSLILGPGFELSTAGGFTTWRSIVLGSVFIALMVSFTLVRHTRSDEDSGRAELVSSGVVGRHARLAAATTLTALESLAIGAVTAALLVAVDAPLEGAAMIGAAYASVGLVFSGVAAVAAQVGAFSRTSNSIAILVVGVTYLLRGFGDSAADAEWVSWLSPFGWAQRTRPFADERWEVLALPLAASVLLVVIAHLLLSRRDLGMGMVAPRTGPAEAGRLLNSSFGLAWRLQAGTLLAWCAGFAVTGLVFGGLASSVADMLSGSDGARDLLAGQSSDLTDAFLTAILSILGITTAAYGTQAVLRARSEETEGRVYEQLEIPRGPFRPRNRGARGFRPQPPHGDPRGDEFVYGSRRGRQGGGAGGRHRRTPPVAPRAHADRSPCRRNLRPPGPRRRE
jgi:ABC-2 type transport system permease protein